MTSMEKELIAEQSRHKKLDQKLTTRTTRAEVLAKEIAELRCMTASAGDARFTVAPRVAV